jgi:hypothetical protein
VRSGFEADFAARIAAKQIADHLRRCGWRFEHTPPAQSSK